MTTLDDVCSVCEHVAEHVAEHGWTGLTNRAHCRDCHHEWRLGTRSSHCARCHQHFASPTSFDQHLDSDGRCFATDDPRWTLHPTPRGWVTKPRDPATIAEASA